MLLDDWVDLINYLLRLFKRTHQIADYPPAEWIRQTNNQVLLERFHERINRHFGFGDQKRC
jgi:hypothetical protein